MSSPMPMSATPRSGPGRAGYVIGAVLLVVTAIGAVSLIAVGARSAVDRVKNYQRVSVSTGGEIEFANAGRYSAYYERPGIEERTEIPLPMRVQLTGPAGERIFLDSDIDRTNTKEQYSFSGHDGVRLTSFDVHRPGRYRVQVLREPIGTSSAELAFGKGALTGLIGGVAVGILGGGLLGLGGFILLIVTAVRRSQHRKRMAYAGYGHGYGAPSYGGPGYGAPGYGGPSYGGGPGYGPPAGPPGWAPPQGAPPPSAPPPTGWPQPGPPPPPGNDPGR